MIQFHNLYFVMFIPIYLGIAFLLKKKRKNNYYIIFFGIFIYYLMYVLKVTLFPIPIDERYLESVREWNSFEANINYDPLWMDSDFSIITREHVLNIAMTFPFGFMINFLWKKNLFRVFVYGLIFSLVIESLQWIISLCIQYYYRVIDINDILFNLLGAVLGLALFKIIISIYVKIADDTRMEHNRFTQYLYHIATGK